MQADDDELGPVLAHAARDAGIDFVAVRLVHADPVVAVRQWPVVPGQYALCDVRPYRNTVDADLEVHTACVAREVRLVQSKTLPARIGAVLGAPR